MKHCGTAGAQVILTNLSFKLRRGLQTKEVFTHM